MCPAPSETAGVPKLIVFDLDFTLWDCGGTWCDCLSPPFCKEGSKVKDRSDRHIRLYADVLPVLDYCDGEGIPMALASRTEEPRWARQLLKMLGVVNRFPFAEIYPSSKLKHFAALREQSGVSYQEMIFFDDESRNIREVSGLGVTCVDVPNGMTLPLFQRALARFPSAVDP